jgi:hypothetical protein
MDTQTGMTNIIVAFRNFVNTPKMAVTDTFNTSEVEIHLNFT